MYVYIFLTDTRSILLLVNYGRVNNIKAKLKYKNEFFFLLFETNNFKVVIKIVFYFINVFFFYLIEIYAQ